MTEQQESQQIPDITNVYRSYQGGYFTTLIAPEKTGGTLALMDMVLPQGAEPPLHMHTREDETFYIIDGVISFTIGGKTHIAGNGDAVFAPRLVPHSFRILSTEARFITMISPGSLWNYFMEFSQPSLEKPAVVPAQGPPPAALVNRLISRLSDHYGVTFAAG